MLLNVLTLLGLKCLKLSFPYLRYRVCSKREVRLTYNLMQ